MCALGVLRGMCAYLWVCAGGVEGDVCIPMCVLWGVEGDVCIPMCVRWGCYGGCVHTYGCALGVLRGMCEYLCVCTGGIEGDVCIPYVCALGVLRGMCKYLWVCSGGVEGDV